MLFPYIYAPHKMDKMQEFIDFIFGVWCNAPSSGPYQLDLFRGCPELYDIMFAFSYSDTAGADFFSSHIERIYTSFMALNPAQISQFHCWYQSNNDIEKVCSNDPSIQLVRYSDIATINKDLNSLLMTFFKGLYDNLWVAALKEKIGDIDEHYDEFVKRNSVGKCPFCGMADIKGIYHSTREAYDHYLPKAIYPFNSVNFHNLVPACHECNSSYKTSKNPAFTPKVPTHLVRRRKVFYPFSTQRYSIDISMDLKTADIEHLRPEDVDLHFAPATISDEIETWKDVYGIEERYKAKICAENDGKYWLMQVIDEWNHDGRKPQDYLNSLARRSKISPYAECNFLKKPFLEACQRLGVI